MDLSIALSAFSLVFLAEMGDKSQILAMTLAHRYRLLPVTAGVLLAFLCLNLLAVWAGEGLYRLVPPRVTLALSGALFLLFALQAWRHAATREDTPETTRLGGHGAFLISFASIFMAELGDKTQLVLLAMAAGTGRLWSVFAGGTLGLWLVSLLAILLGRTVLRRLPIRSVHRTSAVLFLVFGLLALGRAMDSGADLTLAAPGAAPESLSQHPHYPPRKSL